MPAKLTRDHLLPDDVANVAQTAEPFRAGTAEGAVTCTVAASPVPGGFHRANVPTRLPRQPGTRAGSAASKQQPNRGELP